MYQKYNQLFIPNIQKQLGNYQASTLEKVDCFDLIRHKKKKIEKRYTPAKEKNFYDYYIQNREKGVFDVEQETIHTRKSTKIFHEDHVFTILENILFQKNMNDIYLWNQKSLNVKLLQELDINKVYCDHQRRGLKILVMDFRDYSYKIFQGNTKKMLFDSLQYVKKNGSELQMVLVYGEYSDASNNFEVSYSLIIEKYVYKKVISNFQTDNIERQVKDFMNELTFFKENPQNFPCLGFTEVNNVLRSSQTQLLSIPKSIKVKMYFLEDLKRNQFKLSIFDSDFQSNTYVSQELSKSNKGKSSFDDIIVKSQIQIAKKYIDQKFIEKSIKNNNILIPLKRNLRSTESGKIPPTNNPFGLRIQTSQSFFSYKKNPKRLAFQTQYMERLI